MRKGLGIPLWQLKRYMSCPLCPETLSGKTEDWTSHLSQKHADLILPMGDILWIRHSRKPREAFYLGRAYKAKSNDLSRG